MKRILLSVLGTVAGLVSLLSFKTHAHPLASGSALPAESLTPSAGSSVSPTHRATPRATRSSSAATTTPRNFLGGAVTTQYGVVQVKIAVSGHKITKVSLAQLTAFDPRSQEINSAAAPQLLQQTLAAQSAQIDGVSGATYTSDGYRQSLQSALDAAGIH